MPSQPAGRWHGDGEGPAHYFADTPDGAWAEFLRHEEIDDPADLQTIRRQMWAVEIGEAPAVPVEIRSAALGGGAEYLRALSAAGESVAREGRDPSAGALCRADAWRRAQACACTQACSPAEARDGRVIVVFGAPEGLTGWVAAVDGRPAGRSLAARTRVAAVT